MKYYLAYGSNLNVKQMALRCPDAKIIDTGVIHDWRLSFKGSKTGFYLTIDKAKGYDVPVAIWGVSDADERALDRYEGFPVFYHKRSFMITFDSTSEKHECFAYIMRDDAQFGEPTPYYVDTCLSGYFFFGFDTQKLLEAFKYSRARGCAV